MLTERQRFLLALAVTHELDFGHSLGQTKGRLEAVGQTPFDPAFADEAVHDDFDRVLFVPRQLLTTLQEFGDVDDLSVDPGSHETLSGEVTEERVVFTLSTAHHRSQNLEPSALGKGENPIDDLLRGLPGQTSAVLGAVLHTDARVQQAQVVVDLGDRSDGRTRISTGRFLVDRDRR